MAVIAQQQLKPTRVSGGKAARWALAAILLLGAALRLCALGQESLWADEYHSLLNATQPNCRAVCLSAWNQGVQAPYFLILHDFIRVAGQSDLALRLPSAVFGVLAIGVMYLLGRGLFSGKIAPALLAAAILAISPMHVWYSQEARPYALQVLVELLALLALVRGLRSTDAHLQKKSHSTAWLALSAAFVVLDLEIHHFSIFIWAFFMVVFVMAALAGRLGRANMMVPPLILAVGVIHPLLGIADRLGPRRDLQNFLPPSYSPAVILDVLRAQFLGPHWSPLPFWLQCAGEALGMMLLVRGAWLLTRTRHDGFPMTLLPLAGWLVTLLLPTAISLVHPIIFYGQRYLIIALPFTALLLAGNVYYPSDVVQLRRPVKIVAGLAALFFLILQMAYYPPYYTWRQKHLWDQVGAFLARQSQPHDSIYVFPERNAGLLAHYMPGGRVPIKGIAMDANHILSVLRENKTGRVFLVGYGNLQSMSSWLEQRGIRRPQHTGIFETHQPGQILWVNEFDQPIPAP